MTVLHMLVKRIRGVALMLALALPTTVPGTALAHFIQGPHAARDGAHTYLQIVATKYALNDPAVPASVSAALKSSPASQSVTVNGTLWRVTSHGLLEIDRRRHLKKLLTGKDGLPILHLTGIVSGPHGWLWLASNQGAILLRPHARPGYRWYDFWGKRYLGSNQILRIAARRHEAWIRTLKGVSLIQFKPYTLLQKSQLFSRRVRKRYGYVTGWQLLRPGDPASYRMVPTANDGLWTAIYIAAECFQYKATRSPVALHDARTSLDALLRLVSITGIPGFPARALIHKGDYRPVGGQWHTTPDGQWEWRGDTSSDELVGHFFAYWVAYNLLPGHGERARIRAAVTGITDGLIAHHWQLVGYAGRVTKWGRYNPEYLKNLGPRDKALNSLELLTMLRVAYAISGKKRFLDAYRKVAGPMGYAAQVLAIGNRQNPGQINYSDEELAFLSFYPLMQVETSPELRKQYKAAIESLWSRVRSEHNPLWDFIYAVVMRTGHYDRTDAMQALDEIPLSTISWTVNNSQRADMTPRLYLNRFGKRDSATAIPPDERRLMKWNGDPFQMNGGAGGRWQGSGAFFLLPYWFGRSYDLIR